MEWSVILDILKWLIPLGGLGSIAGWFFSRTERELKRIRESHDAYKVMYEDLKETVKEDINEKQELRKTIGGLQRAINKVFSCRHFPDCPVNVELLRYKADNSKQPQGGKRQRDNSGGARSDTGNDSGVESGDGDPAREPP